jgi:hypothetical protein
VAGLAGSRNRSMCHFAMVAPTAVSPVNATVTLGREDDSAHSLLVLSPDLFANVATTFHNIWLPPGFIAQTLRTCLLT